jgi:hypothetical protein
VHEKKVMTCIVLVCWTLLAVPAEKLTEFPDPDMFKSSTCLL